MEIFTPIEPVDYLVIGHISQDITPKGPVLGGTVSYSSLTALALGLRVGIVTSCKPGTPMVELKGIPVVAIPSEFSTTFENTMTPTGRVQHLYHRAATLDISAVPEIWRNSPIVHLGPIAQEIAPGLARSFPNSLVGLTPQGWLRSWDEQNQVFPCDWPEARYVLEKADIAIISIEDVRGEEAIIDDMAASVRLLVVTEGPGGARLYWNGDIRRFSPPKMIEVDPTGAGDIFAAAFFTRLHTTQDPWEATRFATNLAAYTVTRRGLTGVPSVSEIQACMVEVLS